MHSRSVVWLCASMGTVVGGFAPALWGGSQLGLALRRWCPPVLGLAAHASPDEYLAARATLGWEEVSRRFLRAAGLGALYVDTGFEPEPLTAPAELAAIVSCLVYEPRRDERNVERTPSPKVREALRPRPGDAQLLGGIGRVGAEDRIARLERRG